MCGVGGAVRWTPGEPAILESVVLVVSMAVFAVLSFRVRSAVALGLAVRWLGELAAAVSRLALLAVA